MLQLERQVRIKEHLVEKGFASIEELSKVFSVSEMTIRRDLDELQNQGLIQRIYGGAMDKDRVFFEMSVSAKEDQFAYEKEKIGKEAANLVKNDETIFIDSGTTTLEVAKNLKYKKITIITNALNVAVELAVCQDIEIIVIGGLLRKKVLNTVGPQAEAFIKELRVDKAFIGVEGVDPESGISVPDILNAHCKQGMMDIAKESIVVVDHSKLGRTTTSSFAPLEKVDLVLTDDRADPEMVEKIRQLTSVKLV